MLLLEQATPEWGIWEKSSRKHTVAEDRKGVGFSDSKNRTISMQAARSKQKCLVSKFRKHRTDSVQKYSHHTSSFLLFFPIFSLSRSDMRRGSSVRILGKERKLSIHV